ncbi:hypothetical protein WME90_46885 [Sorangium sp. So ce375]|uniref:hypothetical protein n=1 Tax=Sorangium sp. So ce375 TaxID=3133306 RepID=UPI003F5CB914
MLATMGCGADRQEPTAQAASALEVRVSGPFDVEDYPTDFDLSHPGPFKFACGSQRCLAAYRFSTTGAYVLATRIDGTGAFVDTPRIRLGRGESVLKVVARADEFLVVTVRDHPDNSVHYYRIRGSDGRVLDDPTPRLPAVAPTLVAATDASYLFLTPSAGSESEVRLYDAELNPVGDPVIFPLTPTLMDDLIPGEGQYLVVGYGNALRISEATGAALDPAPFVISRYSQGYSRLTRGVYKDGVYQLVWAVADVVQGSRIHAATGEVLDPDDTFNELTGAKLLRTLRNTVTTGVVDVTNLGGDVVASWGYDARKVDAIRVDLTTGLPINGTSPRTIAFELAPAILHYPTFELHPLGESVFLVNDDTFLRTGRVQAGYPTSFGPDRVVSFRTYPRMDPAVASNGNGSLVVFSRESRTLEYGYEILATRIDPATGAYLDDPPLPIGIGYDPTVSSDGSSYLVLWRAPVAGGTRYRAREVRATGTLGVEKAGVAYDTGNSARAQVTWGGSYYGVAWNGYHARFDSDGDVVAPDPLPAGESRIRSLGVTWKSAPRVAADYALPPERRTFLYVGTVERDLITSVAAVRVRSQTGSLLRSTVIAENHTAPIVASDGTRIAVISRDVGTGDWEGVFVDAESGLPVAGTEKVLVTAAADRTVSAFLFDGEAFCVVVRGPDEDGSGFSLRLRRFDRALDPIEGDAADGGRITFNNQGFSSAVVASTGNARGIVAYQTSDIDRLGTAIKLNLFTADGTMPPEPSSSGAGGAGGSGGHGDAGGSVGAAGASGAGGAAGGGGTGAAGGGEASAAGGGGAGAGGGNAGAGGGGGAGAGGGNAGAGGDPAGTGGNAGAGGGNAGAGGDPAAGTGGNAGAGGDPAGTGGGNAGAGGDPAAGTGGGNAGAGGDPAAGTGGGNAGAGGDPAAGTGGGNAGAGGDPAAGTGGRGGGEPGTGVSTTSSGGGPGSSADGCGCRTAGGEERTGGATLFALALAALVRRRRAPKAA